ncbi:MAG: YihY family inner membrane protein [Gallionella sp.]
MQNNWRHIVNFSHFVAMRFKQDRCAQIASSLTFTTLLSIVPLLIIGLTVFSAFPMFQDFSADIKTFLNDNLMPEQSDDAILSYIQQFSDSATRLTTVGIILLASTAMLTMLTIDKAFNSIWRVKRPRPLIKRLVSYWAVLTLSPLLVGASLSLTSWLVSLSMGYAKHIPVFGIGVLKILPVFFTTLAFAIIFRLVPNRYVPRRHALIGALIAAVVFESMNRAFGYYITHFPTYKLVYGTLASVPIFLIWIYLSWLTILTGAVITASLSHWRSPPSSSLASPPALLLDALRVLNVMVKNFEDGKVSTFPALSESLHLGYDTLEVILGKLADAKIVSKAEGLGWLLVRDINGMRATEIFRLFVLDISTLVVGKNNDPMQQWLSDCATRLEQSTNLTLQELFSKKTS